MDTVLFTTDAAAKSTQYLFYLMAVTNAVPLNTRKWQIHVAHVL